MAGSHNLNGIYSIHLKRTIYKLHKLNIFISFQQQIKCMHITDWCLFVCVCFFLLCLTFDGKIKPSNLGVNVSKINTEAKKIYIHIYTVYSVYRFIFTSAIDVVLLFSQMQLLLQHLFAFAMH